MFGIIPLVISIILAGLVAASVTMVSGTIFSDSNAETIAQTTIKDGDKILNAIEMYKFDHSGVFPAALADIVNSPKYFSGNSESWTMGSAGLEKPVEQDVCDITNKRYGYEDPAPSCTSVPSDLKDARYYCCSN